MTPLLNKSIIHLTNNLFLLSLLLLYACVREDEADECKSNFVEKNEYEFSINWERDYVNQLYVGGGDIEAIAPTSDGGFIVGGSVISSSSGEDYWIIKMDNLGNSIWEKTFENKSCPNKPYCGEEQIKFIIPDNNGGFLLAGVIDEEGIGHTIRLIKINGQGSITWENRFYGCQIQYPYVGWNITSTPDNGYILIGTTLPDMDSLFTKPYPKTIDSLKITKINPDGTVLWNKTHVNKVLKGKKLYSPQTVMSVQSTFDGGYMVLEDKWLLKIDTAGNILWDKFFDTESFTHIIPSVNNGFLIVSKAINMSFAYGGSPEKFHILNIDSEGNQIWKNSFNTDCTGRLEIYVAIMDRGELIVAGRRSDKAWLIVVNSNGLITTEQTFGKGQIRAIAQANNESIVLGIKRNDGTSNWNIGSKPFSFFSVR